MACSLHNFKKDEFWIKEYFLILLVYVPPLAPKAGALHATENMSWLSEFSEQSAKYAWDPKQTEIRKGMFIEHDMIQLE